MTDFHYQGGSLDQCFHILCLCRSEKTTKQDLVQSKRLRYLYFVFWFTEEGTDDESAGDDKKMVVINGNDGSSENDIVWGGDEDGDDGGDNEFWSWLSPGCQSVIYVLPM